MWGSKSLMQRCDAGERLAMMVRNQSVAESQSFTAPINPTDTGGRRLLPAAAL